MSIPVEDVATRTYTVPTDQPESDGTLEWQATTMVTAEVRAGGAKGLGWTYASRASQTIIEDHLSDAVLGSDLLGTAAAHEDMVRACRNIGRPGAVSCAISAVDVALWDCKARHLGVPLADLFGRCADEVAIYGSGGFITYDDATARAQLEHWVDDWKIPMVKIKIGEAWGARPERDLARTAIARSVIGNDVALFVDANGAYTRKQAVRMGRALADTAGVTWFEEPVSSDDLLGLRIVRDALDVDVAAGEYGYDETYFSRMVGAGAVDCLQIDVTRCGGYTTWLRAAAVAGAQGLEISAHCSPNLHAHVGVSLPHMRHIEYFHDHHCIETLLFDGALDPQGGCLRPHFDVPGHGMALKESTAAHYQR
jgi:L-alanine-DL-glutamate epimerase-like enolase superfamily enzyme